MRVLLVAVLIVVGVPGSAGAAPPGWRVVKDDRLRGGDAFGDVLARSRTDIWAFGARFGTPSAHRWDGVKWRKVGFPRGYGASWSSSGLNPFAELSASGRPWVLLDVDADNGSAILRFDGQGWREVGRWPYEGKPTSFAVRNDRDVWAFNGTRDARHWDGSRWSRVKVPFLDGGEFVPTPGGGLAGTVSTKPAHLPFAVARYDGRKWTVNLRRGFVSGTAVVGGRLVVSGKDDKDRASILRLTGRGWKREAPRTLRRGERLGKIRDDGRGGFWVAVQRDSENSMATEETVAFLHRTAAGRWLRYPTGGHPHYFADFARVPGTSALVGVGADYGWDENGVIVVRGKP